MEDDRLNAGSISDKRNWVTVEPDHWFIKGLFELDHSALLLKIWQTSSRHNRKNPPVIVPRPILFAIDD
ncbi:hypothetical protein AN958_09575 [Leucoagaricus sp. SymC.cos]|nr:hypothetical protein AN958_09575 [Leucoagaricus sp. SymC.cos]